MRRGQRAPWSAIIISLILAGPATTDILGQAADEPTGAPTAKSGNGGSLSGEEETFDVGGSCAALAYLSTDQLKNYVNSGFSDDFHSFCYPEEPQSCSDYSSFLGGLGHLSTGDDGYHCSLQLSNPLSGE